MTADVVTSRLRQWLAGLFIFSTRNVSKEEDRAEVIQWLKLSRAVIDSGKSPKDKFTQLYALIDSRKTAQIVLNSVVEGAKNYKNSDLPLAVKAAVPMTLLAVPFIGGHGVGIVALGGAIGLPALLVMFLGAAGITSVIEALVGGAQARTYLAGIFELIARDEVLRHVRAAMKNGTQGQPREPVRAEMPDDEHQIREKLLTMSPYDFENHVMSFFKDAGLEAAATQQGSDGGIDGFAKHSDGRLIVVQCKRFAADNIVGRPDIHRFWGAMEENEASQGYFVTTSRFTQHATKSANNSKKIELVDIDGLLAWHGSSPVF
jgi:restriction system protein